MRMTHHTNNHVEEWHSWLGREVANIYEFIEVIQRKLAATEISMLQLGAGAQPPRKSPRAINKNQKTKELKDCFAQSNVSLAN